MSFTAARPTRLPRSLAGFAMALLLSGPAAAGVLDDLARAAREKLEAARGALTRTNSPTVGSKEWLLAKRPWPSAAELVPVEDRERATFSGNWAGTALCRQEPEQRFTLSVDEVKAVAMGPVFLGTVRFPAHPERDRAVQGFYDRQFSLLRVSFLAPNPLQHEIGPSQTVVIGDTLEVRVPNRKDHPFSDATLVGMPEAGLKLLLGKAEDGRSLFGQMMAGSAFCTVSNLARSDGKSLDTVTPMDSSTALAVANAAFYKPPLPDTHRNFGPNVFLEYAARRSDSRAYWHMATYAEAGFNVERDADLAEQHFLKAASLGDAKGQRDYARVTTRSVSTSDQARRKQLLASADDTEAKAQAICNSPAMAKAFQMLLRAEALQLGVMSSLNDQTVQTWLRPASAAPLGYGFAFTVRSASARDVHALDKRFGCKVEAASVDMATGNQEPVEGRYFWVDGASGLQPWVSVMATHVGTGLVLAYKADWAGVPEAPPPAKSRTQAPEQSQAATDHPASDSRAAPMTAEESRSLQEFNTVWDDLLRADAQLDRALQVWDLGSAVTQELYVPLCFAITPEPATMARIMLLLAETAKTDLKGFESEFRIQVSEAQAVHEMAAKYPDEVRMMSTFRASMREIINLLTDFKRTRKSYEEIQAHPYYQQVRRTAVGPLSKAFWPVCHRWVEVQRAFRTNRWDPRTVPPREMWATTAVSSAMYAKQFESAQRTVRILETNKQSIFEWGRQLAIDERRRIAVQQWEEWLDRGAAESQPNRKCEFVSNGRRSSDGAYLSDLVCNY